MRTRRRIVSQHHRSFTKYINLGVGPENLYRFEMPRPNECAVVIPCFNEALTIGSLVTALRSLSHPVIVVSDGSTDDTARVAQEAGATVLSHERCQGKGAALLTGWSHAAQLGFRWSICMDGDGQHLPSDIDPFLVKARETGAALILGNRMSQPEGMPWLRQFVNRWMSRRLSKLAGKEFPDTQCGFRLLDLRFWSRHSWRNLHFEIESELLMAFARQGYLIESVPIQVVYKNEVSKIHPVMDTLRWFRWWGRHTFCVGRTVGTTGQRAETPLVIAGSKK